MKRKLQRVVLVRLLLATVIDSVGLTVIFLGIVPHMKESFGTYFRLFILILVVFLTSPWLAQLVLSFSFKEKAKQEP